MVADRGRRRQCSRPNEQDALKSWEALSPAQRENALVFDDPALLVRVKAALQALFSKHAMLQELVGATGADDPFEASLLLKKAFQFTFLAARSRNDPSVLRMDAEMRPTLLVRPGFLASDDILDVARQALPDFLRASSRSPMPRARWKTFFASDPSSVAAVEQQLAKLLEQAVWAAASATEGSADGSSASGAGASCEVDTRSFGGDAELEPWMAEHDEQVRRKLARSKKGKKRQCRSAPLEPMVEETPREAKLGEEVSAAVLSMHYWGNCEKASPKSEKASANNQIAVADAEDAAEDAEGEIVFGSLGRADGREGPLGSHDGNDGTFVSGRYLQPPPLCSQGASEGDGESRGTDFESGIITVDSESTPRQTAVRSSQRTTVPGSPRGQSVTWNPKDLVCYLWGQTSQFDSKEYTAEDACASSARSTPVGTPSLGQWTSDPCSSEGTVRARAVIRNTFLDVQELEDHLEPKPMRVTRSLSPTRVGGLDYDQCHWPWH